MKIYRRIESMVGRTAYEDWIQQVKAERNNLVRDTVREIESQRQIADSLSRSLESKKAIRDRTKESIFKLSKSPLDSEIEALQVELDKKRNELSQVSGTFFRKPPPLKPESAKEMVPSLFARRVAYSGKLDSIVRGDFAQPKFVEWKRRE